MITDVTPLLVNSSSNIEIFLSKCFLLKKKADMRGTSALSLDCLEDLTGAV